MPPWLIYGANGYTGELIAREAVRRGHRPILAGRHAAKIEPLARELGCEARVFSLRRINLDDVALVLHCAGPFVGTSERMVKACLRDGAHYLDITGEIPVFEAIMARHAEALTRRVTLLPGVGFDVVSADCLAAMLAERLPGATELLLAFYTRARSLSRGTKRTMIELLGEGGAIRRDGHIVRVPHLYDIRTIPFSCGEQMAMTIPWGEVSTAFHSTGIPNIRVYAGTTPQVIERVRRLLYVTRLLSPTFVRRLVQKLVAPRVGPNEERRAVGRTYLWGQVSSHSESRTMTMTTPNAYAFTACSAVNAVERVLSATRHGAFTPSMLLGAEFVTTIPGVLFT